MKKQLLLSASALVLSSSLAAAAEMAVKYVPPAPKPCCEGWEGFYAGVYFGSGQGSYDQSVKNTSSQTSTTTFLPSPPGDISTSVFSSTSVASRSGDTTGSVVNLFAGYNWQPYPYWVIGGQLEGTVFSDITGKSIGPQSSLQISRQTTIQLPGGVTTTSSSSFTRNDISEGHDELRSMFSFLGRAGYLVTPSLLLYAIGGGTFGNFVIPDNFSSGEDSFGGKRNKWVLGYTVGAGGEARLNKNWSLRAEYRYLNFNFDRDASQSSSSTQTNTPVTFVSTSSSTSNSHSTNKFDIHLGTIGVAYRFCYCD